jgi:hypothetical protein
LPCSEFLSNLTQTGGDLLCLLVIKDTLLSKHFGVGYRGTNILRIKSLVVTDGGIDLLHDRGRSRIKATTPLFCVTVVT